MNESIESSDLGAGGAEIVQRVRRGESVVVTEGGTPIADVVPHVVPQQQTARRPGTLAEFARRVAESPPVDAAAWFRDIHRLPNGSPMPDWDGDEE